MRGFPQRLKKLIIDSRMRQKEFAVKIGVTETAVSLFLSGDRLPASSTVVKICRAMDVSADWLLMGGERKKTLDRIMKEKRTIVASAKRMIRELTA